MAEVKKRDPEVDPHTIFLYAEAFGEAAAKTSEQMKQVPAWDDIDVSKAFPVAPTATLDSFALELCLKCLYVTDHNRFPPRKHHVQRLFESLKPGTQKSIRLFYREIAGGPIGEELRKKHPRFDSGIDNCLALCSDTFETVRYLYEGIGDKKLFYWPILRLAVRATILASYPDWPKNQQSGHH